MRNKTICIPTNEQSVEQLQKNISEWVDGKEAFSVSIKSHSDRTLDQNALFHIWLREYAGYLLKKNREMVTEKESEDMKATAKRRCYAETGWGFILIQRKDLITGQVAQVLQSSKKYSLGEMFMFLDWVQLWASDNGLILESKGEHKKLRDEANT